MARQVSKTQSTSEGKPYKLNFNLPTGVTLTDVTVVHTPPSGSGLEVQKIIDAPVAWIYLPTGLVEGRHIVSVVAVTDDAHVSPEIRLIIDVVI